MLGHRWVPQIFLNEAAAGSVSRIAGIHRSEQVFSDGSLHQTPSAHLSIHRQIFGVNLPFVSNLLLVAHHVDVSICRGGGSFSNFVVAVLELPHEG